MAQGSRHLCENADAGSITFDGIDVLKNPNELRHRLGYLPQGFGVYPRISAIDLLDHLAILNGLVNKKERLEVVLGLLAQTNLYQHRTKAVSGFSGGMRQRFGIAQALLGDPDLLIYPSPFKMQVLIRLKNIFTALLNLK